MPHPKKKQRLTGDDINCSPEAAASDNQMTVSANDLSVELLADIFGFLGGAKDIMQKRRVCRKWKEAVKKTIVPLTEFFVDNTRGYSAMRVMTRAMPNLQQITIGHLGDRHKYSDGEDPDEEVAAETANWTAHEIGIISNFSKLRILEIDSGFCEGLNGRYPALFNSFPLLQKLSIKYCYNLKWDLVMLAGFPMLKEFYSDSNDHLTGNISSLRVLKDTLEKVTIRDCENVGGNFMDLADFPHLKKLNLDGTAVTGDIRDIGENHFLSLEDLDLPKGVYGGHGYEFQRISDGPDLIRILYLFKKQHPTIKMNNTRRWFAELSEDSPDRYERVVGDDDTPPFFIQFVEAGSRIGYRWETIQDKPCEVNWLDPEPENDSREYEDYVTDCQRIQDEIGMYRGYYEPPTEEQYTLLYEEYLAEIQRDDGGY